MSLYWKWHKDKENKGKEGRKKDTGTDLGIAESKIKSKARHLRKSVKIRGKARKTVGLAKTDTVKPTSVTGSAKKRKYSKEPNRVTGGIKSVPRRVVSLVLVLVTLVSVLIIGVSGVSADSNDRVATYIKLAADREAQNQYGKGCNSILALINSEVPEEFDFDKGILIVFNLNAVLPEEVK